jgi:outer membrane protein assembly factor BamE (lipoprotein component of BamABCDE complex)
MIEFMQKLIIIYLATFLFVGCGTFDPEGIWQSDLQVSQQYLILKVENDIAIRKPESRNWANFKNVATNKYINQVNLEVIQFQSADKMEVLDKTGKKLSTYSKIILEEADPKVISPQMTKAQVLKFLGNPEEKIQADLSEKWLYKNNLLLIFDEKGVAKLNTNFIKDRDFSKIQLGMTRQQVISIIGNPDKEGIRKESGGGYQKWFYGKSTAIVFDNQKVIDIALNLDKDTADQKEQVFILKDITNDKPVGFVIEDQYNEFLKCDCQITDKGPVINLEGEKSSVNIELHEDRQFIATSSYSLSDNDEPISSVAEEVVLMLSSLRFEKDKQVLGFIRIENNCLLETKGETYPCYFKGTFECTFK